MPIVRLDDTSHAEYLIALLKWKFINTTEQCEKDIIAECYMAIKQSIATN